MTAGTEQPESSTPGGATMFASLRVRNYRLFASGQVVSLVGTWMQRVAQDWLVLNLSGGSPVALGVAAALQFGPTLLLSLFGGAFADRYDKRHILIALQVGMGICALTLGLLDVTGTATLPMVYVLCFLLGCFSAVDAPVRQSFAGEMVGPGALMNAVALNSMTFNTARIVGPAVAGLMIAAVGTGWVFLVNAATFVAVVTGLAMMRSADMFAYEKRPGRALGAVLEGLREVRHRPDLVVLLTVVFFVSTFGINFFMTLAITARNVFGRGAESYGLLTSALAVGCLAGTFVAARRVGRPRLRTVLLAGLFFGVAELFTGAHAELRPDRAAADPDRAGAAGVHDGGQRGRPARGHRVHARAGDGPVHAGAARGHPGGRPGAGVARGGPRRARAAGDRRGRDGRHGADRRGAAGLAGPPARAAPARGQGACPAGAPPRRGRQVTGQACTGMLALMCVT